MRESARTPNHIDIGPSIEGHDMLSVGRMPYVGRSLFQVRARRMTREEALKLISEAKSYDDNEKQLFLRGLMILAKYDDNIFPCTDAYELRASDFDLTVTRMTREEVSEMASMGWFESSGQWAFS